MIGPLNNLKISRVINYPFLADCSSCPESPDSITLMTDWHAASAGREEEEEECVLTQSVILMDGRAADRKQEMRRRREEKENRSKTATYFIHKKSLIFFGIRITSKKLSDLRIGFGAKNV